MKLYQKRLSIKPPVIKRHPAKPNRFRRKKNSIKRHLLYFKQKQARKFEAFANKQPVKRFDSQFSYPKNNRLKKFDSTPPKNWWTPVWSGLVLDKDSKHKKAIKQAIWLYLYLLTVANRRNGQLFRRIKTIASETGFHPRSIERWLKRLREKGYIETHSTGRFLQISITKWKPISRKKSERREESFSRPEIINQTDALQPRKTTE